VDAAAAREVFEASEDFTVGLEEEFGILDPETHELAQRFDELHQAAMRDDVLADSVAGELISSEIEIRSGRGDTLIDAFARQRERRARLFRLAADQGVRLGATGTHPWSRWQDQKIIDTDHYRRVEDGLKYVAWRNNTFSVHVHVGIRGADRAVAVCDRLRPVLPELLAISANSPFLEGRDSGLHSVRSQIFTKSFPRCGIPEAFGSFQAYSEYVDFLYRTNSIVEHTQIWWSIRPHLAYPTIEIRIADGQPDLAEAQSLAAFCYALAVRCARAHDEGEPLPDLPHRLLEENMWRAIRYGLGGALLDFERGEPVPARQRLEQLVEWVAPVAEETGVAAHLAIPERNAAERQIARFEEGASLEEVYAMEVRAGEPIGG